ncbi:MAG: DUF1294 domain-containing protein [Bacteroidaceae bacterium]|nr:DUF1294 domain-containing protein [Bacteroidaceae bacterium]
MSPVLLYTYLFAINIIAFFLYAEDKRFAHYGRWRIPEAVLLATAVLGGAYGAGAAMWLFRHKTRHTAFLWTVPVAFIIWLIIFILVYISN